MYMREEKPPAEEKDKALKDMRAYREFDFTYHPGITEKDLDHYLYDKPVVDYGKKKQLAFRGEEVLLCRNCDWNSEHETFSGYTSRFKVFHTRGNAAIWTLGSNWMLRDDPNDCTLGNEYDALEFLRLNMSTNPIPIPRMHRFSSATDNHHLTLMSRAKGETLGHAWDSYTEEQRRSIAKELGGYIRQWRQFTKPHPQKVDGSQLGDMIIGTCTHRAPHCKNIAYTTEEWLEDLSPELRKGLSLQYDTEDSHQIDQRLQEIKDNFPKDGPAVFTHGDLNLENIIISEGKITGIIDWEFGGFYPWWVERYRAAMVTDLRSNEIYAHISEDLCPGYDKETYDKAMDAVGTAIDAWEECPRLHTRQENRWLRQPFCECKPYCGFIQQKYTGVQLKHDIADKHKSLDLEDIKELLGDKFDQWVEDEVDELAEEEESGI